MSVGGFWYSARAVFAAARPAPPPDGVLALELEPELELELELLSLLLPQPAATAASAANEHATAARPRRVRRPIVKSNIALLYLVVPPPARATALPTP